LTNLSNVPFSTEVVVAATLDTLVMVGGDQADFSVEEALRVGDLGSELGLEEAVLVSKLDFEGSDCCDLNDGDDTMPVDFPIVGVVGRRG
jgi:hypothetical protein